MKAWEAHKLLTYISMFDNRIVDPEGETAKAWVTIPWIAAIEYDLAEEAVKLFFSAPPPDYGPAPYLDPRHLHPYVKVARRNREIEAARESARRGITRGPADPKPADFDSRVAAAKLEAAARKRLDQMIQGGIKAP